MSAQGTYRFYSVKRQTILLVNGEPLGRERVKVCHKQFSTSPLHSSYYSERETKDLNEIVQCSLRTYKQEQTAFNFPFLKETFPE